MAWLFTSSCFISMAVRIWYCQRHCEEHLCIILKMCKKNVANCCNEIQTMENSEKSVVVCFDIYVSFPSLHFYFYKCINGKKEHFEKPLNTQSAFLIPRLNPALFSTSNFFLPAAMKPLCPQSGFMALTCICSGSSASLNGLLPLDLSHSITMILPFYQAMNIW